MLLNIGLALIALWAICFFFFHLIGWFIHILLVVAVIMVLIRIIRGK